MITQPAARTTDPVKNRESETRNPQADRPLGTADTVVEPIVRTRRGRVWRWILVIALAAVAWHYRPHWLPWLAPFLPNGVPPPAKSGARIIPVRTAAVREQDLDLHLNGLGTVTAFKTVTLKSRVDGELLSVAFTEGQMVAEGDLLAEIDARPFQAQLKQAEGQLARDEATLKLAKLTLERVKDLLQSKSIAPQQVDEQVAQVQQMEAAIETDRATVDNARLQLSYCRIISPINGRIGLRMVDQGNIVHANDPTGLAIINQIQPIALLFTIPQDDLPQVQKQIRLGETLKVDAYDRDFKDKLATGELAAVDNQVDSTTGTVRLKAVFENKDGALFPNQFVNARLLVDTRRNAVVVPAAAVQRGPNGTFVYVIDPDEKAELRNVEVGPTEAAVSAIESGLKPGEIVVTDGIDKLQNGTKVTTQEKGKDSRVAGQAGNPPTGADTKDAK
jgi:multidrug efflux system membrane fusion protein